MRKLLVKVLVYGLMMALVLEVLIRIFHLYFEYPIVTLNKNEVVNYEPGQSGSFVIGNRRMNFTEYNINNTGFNSFREFLPTSQDFEVALVGDSFIEGLHQDYYNSIGKKIERNLEEKVQVYEYGFSGNDLADQLYLIDQLEKEMELIDAIYLYLKFDEDLARDRYEVNTRANLENSIAFKIKREVKLLSYLKGIGLIAPIAELPGNLKSFIKGQKPEQTKSVDSGVVDKKYISNLDKLLECYPIDKGKTVFLIDKSITSESFFSYCKAHGYRYVDFGVPLQKSEENTVLKYDPIKHWNNQGREVLARVISYDILKYHRISSLDKQDKP
ncbi:hypothetical protein [Flagellimonas oceanensis]|uniref:hypothetical protein n=1 Tax=Flagellimonas oceanensis TaxID=2499163 RepID=UPI000F8DE11F|nr:hypothetical protein [Allomuricauda oceanensis]